MATKNIHYKIPEKEETVLYPPIRNALELIRNNMREIQYYNFKVVDIPFQTLRNETRMELLNAALQYTKKIQSLLLQEFHGVCCQNRNVTGKKALDQLSHSFSCIDAKISHPESFKSIPIILTGHEPILYHPGIWVKNHLAYYLAKHLDGISINLIVDSDACTMGFTYVPLLTKESASIQKVPFVNDKETHAYEEISFEDANAIEKFRKEVVALMEKNNHPNIKTHIKNMQITFDCFVHQLRHSYLQGCKDMTGLLTTARKGLEGAFGINNLEIPVSLMCKTKGFYYFFLHILFNAEHFAKIYNKKLNDYRNFHKIYSKANPIPDLKIQESLVETPFWIWEKGGARNKCYAQFDTDSIMITNGNQIGLKLKKDEDIQEIVSKLKSLESASSHIKLRPRAIATTMFSRVFFSDVFIHGIGGSKYDAITDEIIKEFLNVNPPNYITASTTLFLPVETHDIDTEKLHALEKELVDIRANPERYASERTNQDLLFLKSVDEKHELIEKMRDKDTDKEKRKQLFNQIKELNMSIFNQINHEFKDKQKTLTAIKEKIAYNKVIKCREYPICIFPFKALKVHFANVFCGSKNTDK
ncbi:MAG: hypothetical protein E3K37_16740 [Candidatus Kuenenia sp.]|nr:hypothetical protein [Candidatus Kuenenia hertensis]